MLVEDEAEEKMRKKYLASEQRMRITKKA